MSYSGVEPVSSDAPEMTGPVMMNQSWLGFFVSSLVILKVVVD